MKGKVSKMKVSKEKQAEILRRYETVIQGLYKQVLIFHTLGERQLANEWVNKYQTARRRYKLQLELIKGI